jgi:Na+-driven multidrug efflux pump
VLGIVLNPLLILGWGPIPAMGIAGSALANVFASLASAALMIVWAYWHDLPLRLRGRELLYLLPLREELGYVLSKGLPMGAQMLINSSAGVIMVGLVNREGMLTTAAYGAVLQIWSYIQMPSFAISMAVSAMVAQNIGAGHHERVGRITWFGVGVNTVVTVVLTAVILTFDQPLFGLFLGHGSGAIPIAAHIQLLSTWAWILSGVMMIMMGTMRAYGVVMVPLIIMVVSQYFARLGFYYAYYPTMGPDALWWSYPFGGVVSVVLTWLAYTRGAWRNQRGAALVPQAAE